MLAVALCVLAVALCVLAVVTIAYTEENVRFVAQLLTERLGDRITLKTQKIVFVTSDHHVLRTAALTRKLGVPGSVIGARTAQYYVPAGFLREFVATL